MTNKETKYAEQLMKFIIGEEVKVKRTKGEKVKLKELGVGHLSSDKSQSAKLGEREYASGTISKIKKDSAWSRERLGLEPDDTEPKRLGGAKQPKRLGMNINVFNKKVDEVYTIINHYVEKGILDYNKDLMEFTKVIDAIADKIN